MKKILTILTFAFALTITNVNAAEVPDVDSGEKITIYMFRSNTCSACKEAVETFNDYEDKYSEYFDIMTFETSDEANHELYEDFIEYFDQSSYVPLFVIGDSFGQTGYNEEEILEEAFKAYQDENYFDLVADTIEGKEENYDITNLEEACEEKGIIYWENESSLMNFIIIGIFAVVIIGLAFLIFTPIKRR